VHVPEAVARRLRGVPPDRTAQEGVAICAETIAALREIPGVAGVHVMAPGGESRIPEILELAGLAPAGAAGKLPGQSPRESASRLPGQPASQSPGQRQSASGLPGQPASRLPGQSQSRLPEQTPGESADRAAGAGHAH
jgi:hypothetical protein